MFTANLCSLSRRYVRQQFVQSRRQLSSLPWFRNSNRAADERVRLCDPLQRLPVVSSPQIRYSEVAKRRQELIEKEQWTIIFKYPHIHRVSFFCRLKVYQTCFTLLMGPTFLLTEYFKLVETELSTAVLCSSLLACLVMLVIGNFAERIVGILYLNEDRSKIRVAHLTFFGHRTDEILNTQDVAHFSDIGEKWDDILVKVHRHNRPEHPFFLSLRHGGIVDRELFEQVFGQDERFPT
ncbi:transmembrane protein 186-like [Ornithodoros turicata]|uniref:transmembrane protein 186-like n=1 Tax=Ornithodoros turicata TaxID=34597 RepID=UPI003139E6BF